MEMGTENVDEQADDIYNGILGEIGLEYEMSETVSLNKIKNEQVINHFSNYRIRLKGKFNLNSKKKSRMMLQMILKQDSLLLRCERNQNYIL